MGSLTLVELPTHAATILLVVHDAEDVEGLIDTANLGQGLVDAVLPCIGTESQQQGETTRADMEATRCTT